MFSGGGILEHPELSVASAKAARPCLSAARGWQARINHCVNVGIQGELCEQLLYKTKKKDLAIMTPKCRIRMFCKREASLSSARLSRGESSGVV